MEYIWICGKDMLFVKNDKCGDTNKCKNTNQQWSKKSSWNNIPN